MAEWYHIKNIDAVDSPALIVYADRVKENIQILTSMVDDVQRLRPHVKTHKTKEASILLIQAGIKKFKCATIAEAEMLAMAGAADILLAYQPSGPKLKRFVSLIEKYHGSKFSCLIDNLYSATSIAAIASAHSLDIPVYLDINTGMNRTGIAPGEDAVKLFQVCASLNGIHMMGLHAYDGQIRSANIDERTDACDIAFNAVENMQKAIIKKGLLKPIIVAGGSPTFPIHAKRRDVECSPGTFIFWDKGYQTLCKEQPFNTAALVISRIVSLPDETKLCLDLGHKSIASENDLNSRVYFLNAPELTFIGHSEEHLIVEAPVDHSYKVGDVLYGLPFHICPTVALYERALLVENNYAAGDWKIIARDRKITV